MTLAVIITEYTKLVDDYQLKKGEKIREIKSCLKILRHMQYLISDLSYTQMQKKEHRRRPVYM